jgi:hypothetical protein
MKPLRWIALIAMTVIVGCDAAAAAFLLNRRDGGGSGGSSTPAPVLGAGVFKVWVASIPNGGYADTERSALVTAKGNPAAPTWTEVGNAALTTEFGPFANPGSFNAILIQASSEQNYQLDAVEILDAQDQVQEHASGTTWSDLVDFPERMVGAPDGSAAITNAAGDTRAFIFTLYSGPIYKFRINGHGQAPASGDVTSVGSLPGSGSQLPGGIAVDPVVDLLDVTVGSGSLVLLARFDSSGAYVDQVQVASGVSAAAGSHSVAIDSSGIRFVAATVGTGQVSVSRFEADLSPGWSVTFNSGFGSDRVESNGIAVDANGNVAVGGGMNSLLLGVNHWLARLSSGGSVLWSQNPDDDTSGATYWRGVTTDGTGQIFASGDLSTTLLGGTNEVRTARYSTSGASQWSELYADSQSPTDLGHAVAVDGSGNIIVGGYLGTSNQGRNALLLRYTSAGAVSSVATHNGPANGNDEILDVAVDGDGSVYAAGYETVAGQGENMWIRKYAPNGAPAWTRTHHGGYGNDRAVSVAVSGSNLVVAGYETDGGGQTKLVLRLYAK